MKWWRAIQGWYFYWKNQSYSLESCAEIPSKLVAGVCYLMKDDDEMPWSIIFQCPCGCRDSIQLNLIGSSPVWSAEKSIGRKISLKPSVWRTTGCKSHFWIIKGSVKWVTPKYFVRHL